MSASLNEKKFVGQNTWEIQGDKTLGDPGRTGGVWDVKIVSNPDKFTGKFVLKQPLATSPEKRSDQMKQIHAERDHLKTLYSLLRMRNAGPSESLDFSFLVPECIDEGNEFLIMRKAEGVPLLGLNLRRKDEKSLLISLRIVIGVTNIIQTAHSHGILYCDFIKDDHVFWDEESRTVTLIDWGNSLNFDVKTGKTRNLEHTLEEDVTQIIAFTSRVLRNYPELSDSILLDIDQQRDALKVVLQRSTYAYVDRNPYLKRKNEIKNCSNFQNYIKTIEFIREDEPSYHGDPNISRGFFKSACQRRDWREAEIILTDYPFYSKFNVHAAISAINFAEGVYSLADANLEWLVERFLVDLDNFSEDDWIRLLRLDIVKFGEKSERTLWKELLGATGILVNKDVDFLYDKIENIKSILVKFQLSSLDAQLILLIKECISYIDEWYKLPYSWDGISYSQFIFLLERIREALGGELSLGEHDMFEVALGKLQKAETLVSNLLGDWENWEEGRPQSIKPIIAELQELDPDRRQINNALIVINEVDEWLSKIDKESYLLSDDPLGSLEEMIDRSEDYSLIIKPTEWLLHSRQLLTDELSQLRKKHVIDNYQLDRVDDTFEEMSLGSDDVSVLENNRAASDAKAIDSTEAYSSHSPIEKDPIHTDSSGKPNIDNNTKEVVIVAAFPWNEFIYNITKGEIKKSEEILKKDVFKGYHKKLSVVIEAFYMANSIMDRGQRDLNKLRSLISDIEKFRGGYPKLGDLYDWLLLFQAGWQMLDNSKLDREYGTWTVSQKAVKKIQTANLLLERLMDFSDLGDLQKQTNTSRVINEDLALRELSYRVQEAGVSWRKLVDRWDNKEWDVFVNHISLLSVASMLEKSNYHFIKNSPRFYETKLIELVKRVKDSDKDFTKILENPGQASWICSRYLDTLVWVDKALTSRFVSYSSPERWKKLFVELMKVPYLNYDRYYQNHSREIEQHPLVDWINNYKPSPGCAVQYFVAIKKSFIDLSRFMLRTFAFSLKAVVVVVAVLLVIVIILIGGREVGRYPAPEQYPYSQVNTTATAESSKIVATLSPTAQPFPTVTLVPSIDPSGEKCNLMGKEEDLQKQLVNLLALDVETRSTIQSNCNSENSYEDQILFIAKELIQKHISQNDFQAALDVFVLLPPDTGSQMLEIRNKVIWLDILFDICSDPRLENQLSQTGLNSIMWFSSTRPILVNEDDVTRVCPSISSLSPTSSSQKTIGYSLLTKRNFNILGSLDETGGAYNIRGDVVQANTLVPYGVIPEMVLRLSIDPNYTAAPWSSLDRMEFLLSRQDIPYELPNDTGWGIMIGNNGVVLIGVSGGVDVYQITNGVVGSLVEEIRGQSINDYLSLRVQVVGDYAFFMYSRGLSRFEDLNYEYLSLNPLLVNNNPRLYIVLANKSPDQVSSMRFIVEKFDVYLRMQK